MSRRGGSLGRALLARLDAVQPPLRGQGEGASFGSEVDDTDDLVNLVLLHAAYAQPPVQPAKPAAVDIGATVAGVNSIADVQDLITLWDYRIQQLGNSFAEFGPTWVSKDPTTFADWSNDWANLQARYGAAKSSAQTSITLAKLNPLSNDEIADQSDYDAIMKAVEQNYAGPGGWPDAKGDWHDLYTRLNAARASSGLTATPDAPPQPRSADPSLAVLGDTSGVSVLDKLGGNIKSPVLNKVGAVLGLDKVFGVGGPGQKSAPLSGPDKVKLLIVLATMGVGGVLAVKLFLTASVKAAVGLAGTILGGVVVYEGVDKLQGVASGANAAIRASKLLNP
jgi:hypothetical protein